jgi:hypothetical protein
MMTTHNDGASLEPPGAGLPPLERVVAHVALRAYAALRSKDKILRHFRSEAGRAIRLVAGLDEEAARTPILIARPLGLEDSSRGWSAAMTLEHLVIVNLGIADVIRALCSADASGELGEIRIEDVKPSIQAGPEQIERLRKAVEIYAKTVEQVTDLKSAARHPHPWFGPLDARGWHALAAIHNGLHRRQLEAISAEYARRAGPG